MRSTSESFTLPPFMVAEIKRAVSLGFYSNRSALVREGIRRILDEIKTQRSVVE